MNIDKSYEVIINWANDIEQMLYLLDIKGKQYIKDYKLKDIQQIDKIIRKCERCGKDFLPNPNFKVYQKYCDIHCRNKSTRDHRYDLKLDERQRPVDLLRKTIYERRYRARRDNITINEEGYEAILRKLTLLVKSRWKLSQDEFDKQMEDLQYEYDKLVKDGKEK